MRKANDKTNYVFGKLTALARVATFRSHSVWLCRCECGNETRVRADNLVSGNTTSCGCVLDVGERNKRGAKFFTERVSKDADPVKRLAYRTQFFNAKRRGIAWEFTYETWAAWWGDDFAQRGRDPEALCMARYNDEGPYSPTNTFKSLNRTNSREAAFLQHGVVLA